jgi:diguanylate cyclase (GGDEF)-like protein
MCETTQGYYRLKRDIVRTQKAEGDGHPTEYKWGKPGFDSVDTKQFFFGVCPKCRFTGELDDADFRQASKNVDAYRSDFAAEALRQHLTWSATGKGITQSLGSLSEDADPLVKVLAQFFLGIYSQSLRERIIPGNLARYYLRIAWLFRDQEKFYPGADLEAAVARFTKVRKRWQRGIPENKEFPIVPKLTLDEADALRYARAFFERNYETLQAAKTEDELRLRQLLAEIGFRLYELTNDAEDFKKASSFFSGVIQQCLGIIGDKSIVGGAVNRAREMLEKSGERGRELRELHKSRGGTEAEAAETSEVSPKKKKKKPVPAKESKESKKQNGQGSLESTDAAKKAAPKTAGNGADGASEEGAEKSFGSLDQATRQVNLLKDELTALKGRLESVEEDNKKWRQLAGRDMLTGLPNKTMLFNLILPKAIKQLKDSGPLSCIAIGLDHVDKVNQGHGWLMGDRMLQESAKGLRKFLADGELLYRLDGANFALVGSMTNNVARQRAADMRRRLAAATVQVDKTQLPLISSLGVVTIERTTGGSVADLANAIYQSLVSTLYRAKDKGGNTVEVSNNTKF